jgi:Domain of Unknown Function with PDB structure (DUF3857)/Transglutaminase-like superfamily
METMRWCNRLAKRRAISRPALLLAAILVTCVPAARAGAPDWLRAIAAQPLGAYAKDTVAVILLDEQVTTVKENGDTETIHRRAYKILRPEGREYGDVVVSFGADTRLTYLKAWSLAANGKEYEAKENEAVETSMFASSLYEDTREKILHIPAADPGNIIAYEYVRKGRPYVQQHEWWFQQSLPVRRARFILELPQGSEIEPQWVNFAGKNPTHPSSTQWVWELENLPAVPEEPQMPPWRAVAGRLVVAYAPGGGAAGESFGSWHAIGRWYENLAEGSRVATPEIKRKVAELTAGAGTAREKLDRLATFVQQKVRYVAIEIGVGGYQPHPADEIFRQRYGDCKDKATLLATMLGDAGFSSYYVLVHSDRGVVLPKFPSALSFNHVILAIGLPQSIVGTDLYATIDDPKLGRLLLFDPTEELTPLGYLPPTLQGGYGLVASKEGGELIKLPLLPPATNRLLRQGKFSLDASGALSGQVEEIRWGEPAASEREKIRRAEPMERAEILEDFLNNYLPGYRLTTARVANLDQLRANVVLVYGFVSKEYAHRAGNLLLVAPRVLGEKGSDLLERSKRKYPVEFLDATLQTDQFEITLPPGFVVEEVPPAVRLDYSFGSYTSKTVVTGNALRYQRLYEIKQVKVQEGQFGDLRNFFRKIAADERAMAVLRRAGN